MSENNVKRNGVNWAMVLTVLFIILKLTDRIDWTWWWVLCPLWISISLSVVIFIVVAVIVSIFGR